MRQNRSTILAILGTIILFFTQGLSIYAQEDEVFINHGSRERKLIALTFDDGPHPKETDKVLDVLKKYEVKATFFVAGKHVNWYPKPLIRANEEGHEIGNHTFNHPDISSLNSAQIQQEIKECEDIVFKITGKKTTVFRPPYGSYRKESLAQIAKASGYKIILWTTMDARDWENPPASQIANKIVENAKNGDIILLHDYATNNTVEALDILIPQLKSKGFEFVTVSKMLENNN